MSLLPRRACIAVAAAAAALALVTGALAHGAGEETVKPLMKQALPPGTGDFVRMATVSYAAGQASKPHLHRGAIFAYVLDGSVVSQLADSEPITYRAGESWYEPPLARHLVSRNASATLPATLLVFGVGKEADPLKDPLPAR